MPKPPPERKDNGEAENQKDDFRTLTKRLLKVSREELAKAEDDYKHREKGTKSN